MFFISIDKIEDYARNVLEKLGVCECVRIPKCSKMAILGTFCLFRARTPHI